MMRLLLLLSTSTCLLAAPKYLPKSLMIDQKKSVFIDALSAHYDMTFDIQNKTAIVETTIRFKTYEDGYPVLDFVNEVDNLTLNGVKAVGELITIPSTKARRLSTPVEADRINILKTRSSLNAKFLWFNRGVAEFFDFSDLTDRSFLENYVPSSFEYDQVSFSFSVKVINTNIEHIVLTNGDVDNTSFNQFQVRYPKFYNSSSIFFHIRPVRTLKIRKDVFNSISGAQIPITVFERGLFGVSDSFMRSIQHSLEGLEADYGPYPHKALLIWNTQDPIGGGMEYAGATRTSPRALRHELDHMWFARSVMPSNGNSGWIDEAIASWGDIGHAREKSSNFDKVIGTGSASPYSRITNRMAYTAGRDFISNLDTRFADQGGLRPFLKHYAQTRKGKISSQADFLRELNLFFSDDISKMFWRVVGAKKLQALSPYRPTNDLAHHENEARLTSPFHQILSEQEKFNLK